MSEDKKYMGKGDNGEQDDEENGGSEGWRVCISSLVGECFRALVPRIAHLTSYELCAEFECSTRECRYEGRHRDEVLQVR
jgi:hypothetical protein